MTTSKSFEDYPGSESGEILEDSPGNYVGRKPVSQLEGERERGRGRRGRE